MEKKSSYLDVMCGNKIRIIDIPGVEDYDVIKLDITIFKDNMEELNRVLSSTDGITEDFITFAVAVTFEPFYFYVHNQHNRLPEEFLKTLEVSISPFMKEFKMVSKDKKYLSRYIRFVINASACLVTISTSIEQSTRYFQYTKKMIEKIVDSKANKHNYVSADIIEYLDAVHQFNPNILSEKELLTMKSNITIRDNSSSIFTKLMEKITVPNTEKKHASIIFQLRRRRKNNSSLVNDYWL